METTRSHKRRGVDLGAGETSPRYCPCGKRSRGLRGCRGFCSDECRFWSKAQKGPDCWLWLGGKHISKTKGEPYGQFYYKGRPRRAHIVAWALSHGGILPGVSIGVLGVCHKCDTPLCVRPDHLFLGTQHENMLDAARKGRLHVARPGRQKVTAAQIELIRHRVASGELHKAVAADFGIARNTVSEIMSGKRRQYDAPLQVQLKQVG